MTNQEWIDTVKTSVNEGMRLLARDLAFDLWAGPIDYLTRAQQAEYHLIGRYHHWVSERLWQRHQMLYMLGQHLQRLGKRPHTRNR